MQPKSFENLERLREDTDEHNSLAASEEVDNDPPERMPYEIARALWVIAAKLDRIRKILSSDDFGQKS